MNTKPGIIGKKLGMTQLYKEDGTVQRVTVVDTSSLQIVGKRTKEKDGYTAIVFGMVDAKEKHLAVHRLEATERLIERVHDLLAGERLVLALRGISQLASLRDHFSLQRPLVVRGELAPAPLLNAETAGDRIEPSRKDSLGVTAGKAERRQALNDTHP